MVPIEVLLVAAAVWKVHANQSNIETHFLPLVDTGGKLLKADKQLLIQCEAEEENPLQHYHFDLPVHPGFFTDELLINLATTTTKIINCSASRDQPLAEHHVVTAMSFDMSLLKEYGNLGSFSGTISLPTSWTPVPSVPGNITWQTLYSYNCTSKLWNYQLYIYNHNLQCGVSLISNMLPLLNQCSIFSGSLGHKCAKETTICSQTSSDFSLGNYECICKSCNLSTNASDCQRYPGADVERNQRYPGLDVERNPSMMDGACRNSPPWADVNLILKYSILTIQLSSMAVATTLAILVGLYKTKKKIESSGWLLLEVVLVGGILLYATVAVEYLQPSNVSCLLYPWIREVGFVCTYGGLLLKTYKTMSEFKTRKARRIHIRDTDLLKYWFWTLVVVVIYLMGWTALNVDYIIHQKNVSLTVIQHTEEKHKFLVCVVSGWDLVTEGGELMFLMFGLYMAYSIRQAPSVFWECKFILVVLVVEAIVSMPYTVFRYMFLVRLHPDMVHLISFLKVQLTVTLTLSLTVGTKIWYLYRPPQTGNLWSNIKNRKRHQLSSLNASFNSTALNGDLECPDMADLEPDELRVELRRVYAQLQILKKDVMRHQNPHIPDKKKIQSKYKKNFFRQLSKAAFYRKSFKDTATGDELQDIPEKKRDLTVEKLTNL